jgi:hypothetical protein
MFLLLIADRPLRANGSRVGEPAIRAWLDAGTAQMFSDNLAGSPSTAGRSKRLAASGRARSPPRRTRSAVPRYRFPYNSTARR